MAKPAMGAWIQYCGHNGCFLADIWQIGDVNVVYASRPVTPDNLERNGNPPTHHLLDFPKPGFWRPKLGIFVVPATQVKEVK